MAPHPIATAIVTALCAGTGTDSFGLAQFSEDAPLTRLAQRHETKSSWGVPKGEAPFTALTDTIRGTEPLLTLVVVHALPLTSESVGPHFGRQGVVAYEVDDVLLGQLFLAHCVASFPYMLRTMRTSSLSRSSRMMLRVWWKIRRVPSAPISAAA